MLRKISLAAIAALTFAGTAEAQPAQLRYVNSTCSISMAEFNTWFASGQMSKGGLVTFANSVGFPTNNTVCDFYKWAHQMFLWIVSPVGGGIVLTSPVFFDVNFNAQGNGVFIPNSPGRFGARTFALRGTKPEKIQPGGQAGGGDTLLSLNGALVYFGIHANDVYAWFNTAVINNAPGFPVATTPFPTTQPQLANIVAYAAQNGAILPDANALTLELKTAWVDAATVPNPADYVTIQAAVPNYVGGIGAATWTIGSPSTVNKTLALVGLHVVGPVQGHPEMVWATFEHRNNAPDNTYYFNPNPFLPLTAQVPYNSAGLWSFMTNSGAQQGALVAQAKVDNNGNVVAVKTPPGIQVNNVYRVNPWGDAPTPASAGNNSQLLSLNIDIRTMLDLLGDVRQNYFQIGAVWTRNGSIPANGNDTANQIGSLLLANSTMETYRQAIGDGGPKGCFGCHANSPVVSPNNPNPLTGTSHLFSPTNVPLPTR